MGRFKVKSTLTDKSRYIKFSGLFNTEIARTLCRGKYPTVLFARLRSILNKCADRVGASRI